MLPHTINAHDVKNKKQKPQRMTLSVNNRIFKFLCENQITQAELAKRTGIQKPNINRIIYNDDLRVSHLVAISKALGVPDHYFLYDQKTTKTPLLTPAKAELIRQSLYADHLTPDQAKLRGEILTEINNNGKF